MVEGSQIFSAHVIVSFFLLVLCGMVCGTDNDISCLRSVKAALQDPYNYLQSWDFNNKTEGYICKFTGVECWHPDENRVLNLKLSNMGLKGEFPRGVENCSSMTGLDFSLNRLSKTIPADISTLLTFVTSIDLSSNDFTGEIPASLSNCTYLNTLRLDQNQLSGQIPANLSQLPRLKMFSVSNNLLTGQVPSFKAGVAGLASYAHNSGLCGVPLDPCQAKSQARNTAVIAGAAVGGVTVAALGLGIGMFFYVRRISYRKREEDPEGNKWARSLKGTKTIKVSMFEKAISKMNLNDLMKAAKTLHSLMASSLIRLRRTLRALSGVTHSISAAHASSFSAPIRCAVPWSSHSPKGVVQSRSFRSSSASFLSVRSSQSNIPDEIGPDTILFEGCDYNHWLFVMDFPRDNKPSPEDMVRAYEETCAKGLNISVEEAKKKIYACSTTTYTGFQAVMTEEESKKFEGLPGVIFVLPDSYIDPVNKQYGGDQYIDGTIIPRPPPVQYGRNQGRRDRNRSPGQYNRQENPSYNSQESMQGDGRNYGPSQNYPPSQNYGQASQNYPPQQNYGQSSQNYPPQQNYGQASQNYPPQQKYGQTSQNNPSQQSYGQTSQNNPSQPNYGQTSQNNPPQQNYGQTSQNNPPQPNYGQSSQNYPPQQRYGQTSQNYSPQQNYGQASHNYPPQQNYGQASRNFPPQQNYGQTPQNYPPQENFNQASQNYPPHAQQQGFGPPGQGERSYMPQQNFGRPGQGERRDTVPRHGASDVRDDTFIPSYMKEFEQAEQQGNQPSGRGNFTGEGRY